ncbi:MAG: hypothetical protein IPK04_05925 [Bdellovibrionales bacterium]|nr:hypothetical protein [Bdellovibrionales bacterium]
MRSPHFKQGIFIGSQIAERNPDINAASYTAAKHALLGIISTLQKEALEGKDTKKASLAHDLRLFSPGYMNTSLLPPTAWPRLGALRFSSQEFWQQSFFNGCKTATSAVRIGQNRLFSLSCSLDVGITLEF